MFKKTPEATAAMKARMKALSDDDKMKFAINWHIPHSLFNIAAALWPDEVNTTALQSVEWFEIFHSHDLGVWSHGGVVVPCYFHSPRKLTLKSVLTLQDA